MTNPFRDWECSLYLSAIRLRRYRTASSIAYQGGTNVPEAVRQLKIG
jgi:hypothetical protein